MSLPDNANVFWFTPNKQLKLFIWIFAACILGCFISFAALFYSSDKSITDEFLELLVFGVLFLINLMLLGGFIFYQLLNKQLGISGRLILIQNNKGETAISPLSHAYYVGERGILVEDMFFIIGHEHKILSLDKDEYRDTLLPTLPQMGSMGEWGYFKYRMANMNQESTLICLLFTSISILCLYGYLTLN